MLPSDLRTRIAELKRSALRNRPTVREDESGEEQISSDHDVTVAKLPPPSVVPRATADDARIRLRLDDVASGREETVPPGKFYLIDQSVEELIPRRGPVLKRRFLQLMSDVYGKSTIDHDDFETFGALAGTRPEGLAFIDIEATGFTPGTPLFLVGLAMFEDGDLRVRQLLARDYTEEGALLFHLWKLMGDVTTVVSFNGKTYDLPYIRDRMVYYGYRMAEADHIDLLHEGRRRYKNRLVNCKLQTLEKALCGRGRIGDIPGSEIPDAYHDYVRTGNAVDIRDILQHNALDLVTMVEVVLFMLEGRTL